MARRRKLKMTKSAVAARRRYRANRTKYRRARQAKRKPKTAKRRKPVDRKRLGWGHAVRVKRRRETRQSGLKLGPPWPKNRQPPHCIVCGLHAKYEGTSPSGRVYFLCGKHRNSGNLTNRRRAPNFKRKTRRYSKRRHAGRSKRGLSYLRAYGVAPLYPLLGKDILRDPID